MYNEVYLLHYKMFNPTGLYKISEENGTATEMSCTWYQQNNLSPRQKSQFEGQ